MASGNSTQSVILCVEQRAQRNHGRALTPILGPRVRGHQQERIGPLDPDPPSRGAPDSGHTAPVESTPSARPARFLWMVDSCRRDVCKHHPVGGLQCGRAGPGSPLQREFNTTRTAIAIAFSLRRLEGGLTGPVEGYLIHWIGPQRYMMGGWVIFGVGFICIGLSQNLYQFYASFLLVTLGQSVAGFLAIVTVLINWFDRWRGRTIAIYQLGNSVGALLIPVLAWSILDIGWRETTIAIGVGTIIIGVPLAAVMRGRPEDYGYLPDGERPGSRGTSAADGSASRADKAEAIDEPTLTVRPIPPRPKLLVPGAVPLRRDVCLGGVAGPPDTGAG